MGGGMGLACIIAPTEVTFGLHCGGSGKSGSQTSGGGKGLVLPRDSCIGSGTDGLRVTSPAASMASLDISPVLKILAAFDKSDIPMSELPVKVPVRYSGLSYIPSPQPLKAAIGQDWLFNSFCSTIFRSPTSKNVFFTFNTGKSSFSKSASPRIVIMYTAVARSNASLTVRNIISGASLIAAKIKFLLSGLFRRSLAAAKGCASKGAQRCRES
jgi:hypothetical protein